jgi:WD40 repeat protein
MRQFQVGRGIVRKLDFTPDGKELVVQDAPVWNTEAVVWIDSATGKERQTWPVRVGVVFSPDHSRIAVSNAWQDSDRNEIWIYDGKSLKQRAALPAGWNFGLCFAFAPDSRHLLVGDWDGKVSLWDVPRRRETLQVQRSKFIEAVAVSPSGRRLAGVARDGIVVWSRDDPVGAEAWKPKGGGRAYRLAFVDESRLALVYRGVLIWDADHAKVVTKLKGLKSQVNDLAVSPDGALLATASNDGTARLWDTATWQERVAQDGGLKQAHAVAFAPDGRSWAVGGDDGRVVVWQVGGKRGPGK